ncbi:hypothetical protein IFM89_020265 [Coptis chinensis]|uniref:Uncharacterized protein n=1 Tax=Coptis chinensis TaxID=261450 RepID=A0A835HQY3_9MAGN|nr:hypothetical protein IFM89_020265 [Coptis chinensis]
MTYFGVDINTGGIIDTFANFVWEPTVVKINAINATTEAACLILSVDETEEPKGKVFSGLVSESAQGDATARAMGSRAWGRRCLRAWKGNREGIELLGLKMPRTSLE